MNEQLPPKKFWFLLFAPAGSALLVFGVKNGSDIGIIFAKIALLLWIVTSITGPFYCGRWLAKRSGKSGWQLAAVTLFCVVGLLGVNLAIAVAGCSSNFHMK